MKTNSKIDYEAREKADIDYNLSEENKSLRAQIARMRQNPGDIPFTACGHSCVCASAEGMATNGPCRCDERTLRRAVQY
jgi:hypothetical protein